MATSKQPPDLAIHSLRGGQNDQDPPHSLDEDQCTLALNVEFFLSTLGERRQGCEAVDLTGSNLDSETHLVFLGAHLPEMTDVENSELWAVSATPDVSTTIAHRAGGAWAEVTPDDPIDPNRPDIFRIQAVSIHGKLYICYRSGEERMHVWDGTSLRRAGLAQPAAPTVSDSGNAGSYTGDRIFRVRFITMDGTDILLRSEPSEETPFTPSGSDDGATIDMPALINEAETHWEIEASDGDGNFYRIATEDISTTTYTDTIQPATGYADFPLSEVIGEYHNIGSAKFVIADQDRLIFGGSFEDPKLSCRIAWTAVSNAEGVGNDERNPLNTDSFIDLDWQEGGELTGLSTPINGSFYAFKHARIYKVQRTGNIDQAYEAFLLSSYRGAVRGSVVNGVDERGAGCVYFLDPSIGPGRIGSAGLQFMHGIRGTWLTANTKADDVVAHGVYYPDKQQVHWWIATGAVNTPNYKIVSQINEIASSGAGTSRGWSVANGTISEAICSATLPEIVGALDGSTASLSFRPYIGMIGGDFILRCDIGDTDAGDPFTARIVSKPYILAGLLNRWGAMTAALLAVSQTDPDITVDISFIRNFGTETSQKINRDFLVQNNESLTNIIMDNLHMSEGYAIQFQIEDGTP